MEQDFESEAHVVLDGEEVPVSAFFTVSTGGPLKEWSGTLTSDEPGLGFKLVNARRTVLRMPDGKEGKIVPTDSDGSFKGSGPAPV
ncbi:hypothetical protein ACIP98_21130 [Streptomyces sp. NPDC088354]|uniref:hypothetical protein n=1 Tax=Streptomyces sp. NPDC088354 TaxID=3365856 RepID=UPI0037F7E26C